MSRNRQLSIIFFFSALFCSTYTGAAECEFSVDQEWNSGFISSVLITNTSSETINGWSVLLSFTDDTHINHLWNGNLSGIDPHTITNQDYNETISPNETVSFGFNAEKPVLDGEITAPSLGGICSSSNDDSSPNLAINASLTEGQAPLSVEFYSEVREDIAFLSYAWSLDGEVLSSAPEFTYVFDSEGSYDIVLSVQDANGNVTQETVAIDVTSPQQALAQCTFEITTEWLSGFTAQISIYNPTDTVIEGWQMNLDFSGAASITGSWDSVYSGADPYLFTNASYNEKVQPNQSVSFGFNANKSSEGSDVVAPLLSGICSNDIPNRAPTAVASATPNKGQFPLVVVFDGSQSVDPDGDNLTYFWTFEDGSTSQLAQIEKTFLTAGEYTATLIVSDGELESEPDSVSVDVIDPNDNPNYVLDEAASSLFFVSTKKIDVVESHTFTRMTGHISQNGDAVVSIDLSSVESGIDIRNERMREHLFEITSFPSADVRLTVNPQVLADIDVGSSAEHVIQPTVEFHGVSLELDISVKITRLSDEIIMVQSVSPIILQAQDFDLAGGIEILRNLAGLDVISYAVPTNFTLFFSAQ